MTIKLRRYAASKMLLLASHFKLCMRFRQSLSLPGPSGAPSSSSSTTASAPAMSMSSAFCKTLLNSVFIGSTRSMGLSLALFRILQSNMSRLALCTLKLGCNTIPVGFVDELIVEHTSDHNPHPPKYPPLASPPPNPP